ncbi:MAG: GNAT family N-acetyltransferase [Bosea sp. (in: a-proteobacteria)]
MNGNPIVLNVDGYTDVPHGKMATVVSYLEMLSPPAPKADPPSISKMSVEPIKRDDTDRYLRIYRTLGERWMWFSRLVLERSQLKDILGHAANEAYAVKRGGHDCGLLELDFREPGECEIAFFGLYESELGSGAGRWLMNRALTMAWRPDITRVWVHTCTFDHPGAPDFYRRSGFVLCKLAIEVCDDPRLNGKMRREAAPHVPLIT